jgi:hypothetical protein
MLQESRPKPSIASKTNTDQIRGEEAGGIIVENRTSTNVFGISIGANEKNIVADQCQLLDLFEAQACILKIY